MEININGLTKRYGKSFKALDNVNLTIRDGLFGLLGPNGAGKTSLMRILVTLMPPTSGGITVDGKDLNAHRAEIRQQIGYLPQGFSNFPKLKSWEFLDYSARLAGIISRKDRQMLIDELLEKVGLLTARDKLANKLSGGMKRRLGIAQALIGDPAILIVDEPTTGLDPEERIRFRNILAAMGQSDRIILLSTHIVDDISSTCNQMALLNRGQVAFTGRPNDFIDIARGHTWRLRVPDASLGEIRENLAVTSTIPTADGWEVEVVADKVSGFDARQIEPNLEHAYVYFTDQRL